MSEARPGMNRALFAVLGSLCLAGSACTTGRSPVPASGILPGLPGYQAFFRGQSDGPEGRSRFRLAVTLLPPDRLRMEFYGPAGGPRLVIAATRDQAVALRPSERVFERSGSPVGALEGLVGVPLDAAGVVSLFMGRPMCPPEAVRVEVQTRPAATFGRTVSWYEVSCPPGEIRYQARCAERGGTLISAVVREGISGAIILEVEYGDYEKGLGPRWPRQIRLRLPRKEASVDLSAVEGPWARNVPEEIVSPAIPEGFRERAPGRSPDLQGLLDPGGATREN
jgi:hypothetical protein